MSAVLSIILDVIMIGLLITGIAYAVKLHRQLLALRASRGEMERFVAEFSQTVQRAEAGIKGLKLAAREGGDDLEKQIDKAQQIKDELQFLVQSADQIATRLSDTAASAARAMMPESVRAQPAPQPAKPAAKPADKKPADKKAETTAASSRAEAELLQALEKLG